MIFLSSLINALYSSYDCLFVFPLLCFQSGSEIIFFISMLSLCFSGKERNLNIIELLCVHCNRWYHESCIGYQLGKIVPFMMNYTFVCKNCSPTGLESFRKTQACKYYYLFCVISCHVFHLKLIFN